MAPTLRGALLLEKQNSTVGRGHLPAAAGTVIHATVPLFAWAVKGESLAFPGAQDVEEAAAQSTYDVSWLCSHGGAIAVVVTVTPKATSIGERSVADCEEKKEKKKKKKE